MNKSKTFLIIVIMLLGIAVVPSGSVFSATQIEPSSSVTPAALAETGTLKVSVVEDTSVVNGTNSDTNFGADIDMYLGTAHDAEHVRARSWFKFDLNHLPKELSVQRATMNVFIVRDYLPTGGADEPIGVYYCANNTWDQMSLTWNLQPTFSGSPTSIIDSPASPNMFVPGNWYSWEITHDVRSSLAAGDKTLSEVLKFTEEIGTQNAFLYPMKHESYPFNATYLEIEYTAPSVSGLTVDGIASGAPLDYINNPCPELGWTFSDPDFQDFQKDYEVEIWNNTHYNDTLLWQRSHEFVNTIHDSGAGSGNYHPFGNENYGMTLQMKFPSSEISRSGIVDKLYFNSHIGDTIAHLENLEVALVLVPSSTYLTTDFTANLEGRTPTVVLSRDSYDVTLVNGVIEMDIEDTFYLDKNLNLIIEFRMSNNTGTEIPIKRTTIGGPGSVACAWGIGDEVATTADYTEARTYDLRVGYLTQTVYNLGGSTNGFPFGCTVGQPGRFQIKYNQSYIGRSGYLDKFYFPVHSVSGEVVYDNLRISVVETPVQGAIDHADMDSNYGGRAPAIVLDESTYTIRNLGYALVIDLDNSYYYSNTNDLLIDFQWESLVSGNEDVRYSSGHTSSFRAWDLHWSGDDRYGNGTAGYNLLIDFVNDDDSTPLDGCITLVEGERYYWRVRTCDSTGVWGDWTSADFKFETLSELPVIDNIVVQPLPVEIGQEVSVSADATHSLGIYAGWIEFGGTNHSMTGVGGTYSYAWTPAAAGMVDYTIYIQSNGNTWASFSDQVNVTAAVTSTTNGTGTGTGTGTDGGDMTMILIIAGGAAVVIIIIIIIMKKKK